MSHRIDVRFVRQLFNVWVLANTALCDWSCVGDGCGGGGDGDEEVGEWDASGGEL